MSALFRYLDFCSKASVKILAALAAVVTVLHVLVLDHPYWLAIAILWTCVAALAVLHYGERRIVIWVMVCKGFGRTESERAYDRARGLR